MAKKQFKHIPFARWYKGKDQPDDTRDVLAFIKKPVFIDARKRMELMEQMQVIHMEDGKWFLEGRPLPPKNVMKWTEIPAGWQD